MRPDDLTTDDEAALGQALSRETTALDLLRRPELDHAAVTALSVVGAMVPGEEAEIDEQVAGQLDVAARYAGYIERQEREIARHARQESLRLPDNIDYGAVAGLSIEARQRLEASRPATLGQASRLEGMTPSAVSLILIHLKKRHAESSLSRSA